MPFPVPGTQFHIPELSMKVKSKSHVYHYLPNFLNNRQLPAAEQIVVKLKVISTTESDDYQHDVIINNRSFAPDKAQELNEKRFQKLVTEKFVGIEGLEIEGLEGKELDFDTFYSEAPPEIVGEVLKAIRSAEMLSAGEQKNFVPESDSL